MSEQLTKDMGVGKGADATMAATEPVRRPDSLPADQDTIDRVCRGVASIQEGEQVRAAIARLVYANLSQSNTIKLLQETSDKQALRARETREEAEREDLENIGRAFMDSIHRNMPDYSWNNCPSEIIVDLINERDEARASAPPAAVHPIAELFCDWWLWKQDNAEFFNRVMQRCPDVVAEWNKRCTAFDTQLSETKEPAHG